MSTAQTVASGHEQVMMELYSLLGSAESVGVHTFFFLHKLTHVHSLLIQIPTEYFLYFFFFFFFFKFNLYSTTGELVFLVFENSEF